MFLFQCVILFTGGTVILKGDPTPSLLSPDRVTLTPLLLPSLPLDRVTLLPHLPSLDRVTLPLPPDRETYPLPSRLGEYTQSLALLSGEGPWKKD